jgi:hypothetical protein
MYNINFIICKYIIISEKTINIFKDICPKILCFKQIQKIKSSQPFIQTLLSKNISNRFKKDMGYRVDMSTGICKIFKDGSLYQICPKKTITEWLVQQIQNINHNDKISYMRAKYYKWSAISFMLGEIPFSNTTYFKNFKNEYKIYEKKTYSERLEWLKNMIKSEIWSWMIFNNNFYLLFFS